LTDGKRVIDQQWVEFKYTDNNALKYGDLIVNLTRTIRKYKHDSSMALNAKLGDITIYAPSIPIQVDVEDLNTTLNGNVIWKSEDPKLEKKITGVIFNKSEIGKTFRKKASAFMNAVNALHDSDKINPPKTINVDGDIMNVPENAWTLSFGYTVSGDTVDVILMDNITITIKK
ncbi:MAG TPA: valine--tRNA ligase, partial [Methanocorpusculum sp.]|nr:valine--tRNA ligase [Methanocorpusculum sp.]